MRNSLLFLLIILTVGCQQQADKIPDEIWSKNNVGVGQMGSFDYEAAFESFREIHQNFPEEPLFQHNYIISRFNRQKQGDEEQAIEDLKAIIQSNPNDIVAHYLLGLLYFNQGSCETANEHFSYVVNADTNDAYAKYFFGQCQLQLGNLESAYSLFNSSIALDPYLRSAYYGAFMVAQRQGLSDEAERFLEDYQKLEMNPQSRLAEIKYTRMGPKAMAQTNLEEQHEIDNTLKTVQAPFVTPQSFAKPFPHLKVTVVNFEEPEIWVAANDKVEIYRQIQSTWNIDRIINAPGLHETDHISITDVNQDGLLDGYVTSLKNEDKVFIQSPDNNWDLVAQPLPEANLPQSRQIKIADIDHDGDLDVISLDQQGRLSLINNNGNNTFQLIELQEIEGFINNNFIDVDLIDIDGDRDLDLLLLKNNELLLLANGRLWNYHLKQHALAFNAKQLLTKYDDDGSATAYLSDDSHNIHISNYDAFNDTWQWSQKSFNDAFESFTVEDFDGNGEEDWLLFSANQIQYHNQENQSQIFSFENPLVAFHILASKNGPELLCIGQDELKTISASQERNSFLTLGLTGKELTADSMRSNALGIGTELIVHNGQFHKKSIYLNHSHHSNQSIGAINIPAFSTADEPDVVDFIEIQWPDGVYQTELNLQPGEFIKITETQRQLSSCPVLFIEQNGSFEFLTDVMGVGATGFLIDNENYASPRDWEFLLLSQQQVEQSQFNFLVTEPMEETMFLDALAMKYYETEVGINAVLDERLAIKSDQPTGELMFYKERWLPRQIISQNGEDTTSFNQSVDANPLPVGELDLRFLGRLKEPQEHVMIFEQVLEGNLILMLHGWVEYGYSQTSFAAWQAGESLQYPSLDVEIDGEWVNVLDNWGFPAGMPKMSAIKFTLPEGKTANKLRIRSTQEVYIDQISVAERIYPEVKVHEIPLVNANLSIIGFPKRDNGPHRYPIYDFSQRKPFADTRHMTGAYTQLGPVEPLVEQKDNALAIVSGGEAVTFKFDKPEHKPAKNRQRFYVMEFYGWAKDMDILTENDKYLTPLPHSGEITPQANALNKQYNTRFMSGN